MPRPVFLPDGRSRHSRPGVVAALAVLSLAVTAATVLPAAMPATPVSKSAPMPVPAATAGSPEVTEVLLQPASPVRSRLNAGERASTPPLLGLHVPWADGANRWDANRTVISGPEPWPDFPVGGVRLWDTRTTWAHVEPHDNQWQFTVLDAHVAAAHQAQVPDVLLVLGGTPAWAAQRPDAAGAPWLPVGSASPPRSIADWRDYVRTVADRYRGRIDVYQVGNEPNYWWFWQGSPREMTRMGAVAGAEIGKVDPTAMVVGPGPVVTDAASVARARAWWRVMAGTGVDALTLQWYPARGTRPAELTDMVSLLRRQVAGTDVAGAPVWITEVNHDRRGQAARLVRGTMRAAEQARVERVYWYAWTTILTPTLLPLHAGSPAGKALARYAHTAPSPA